MDSATEPFGTALRRLRERKGWTREELAERAGLSPKAIGALERGERRHPYPNTLRALAGALDLSADERAALEATVAPRARRTDLAFAPARLTPEGNLPAEVATFVGRRRALSDAKSAFARTRLVSVLGPGGVGKTRLALRVAADLRGALPGGAWLVELAGLGDPRLVPKAVMTALGMRDQGAIRPVSMLVGHLAGRRLLLVLDNCEHLLDACAGLVDVLLREAPGVQILATTRQPLNVAGEHVIVLQSLTLPPPEEQATVGRLARSEAIDLFVQRAAEATGGFRLGPQNQRAVLEICRRLDGMPLAIELAAVRLRTLGVEQILERLNDRFRLLVDGNRAALPRQQTLRATIEWSYDLLGEDERAVLRRLSVFAGGFGLEAAEAVCTATGVEAGGFLGLLTALVEKSVVSREGTAAAARYRLHETMREYARLRLAEAGEESVAIEAHLQYCRALCRRADEEWFGPHLVGWLDRFDLELDDLRAALRRCLADPAATEVGLEMVGSMWSYWMCRAVGEGAQWIDRMLRRPGGEERTRARALFARGSVAMHQPDLATGLRTLHQAVDLARRVGDEDTRAFSLGSLAIVQALAGELDAARATAEQLTWLAEAAAVPSWISWAEAAQVIEASHRHDFERARVACDRLAKLGTEHGESWMLSYAYLNLGSGLLMADRGDPEAAARLTDALRLKRLLDDRSGIAYTVLGLACHAVATHRADRGATLLGAVEALQRREGMRVQPFLLPYAEEARERATASLGQLQFQSACEQGMRLDRESAIAYALGEEM